MATERDITLKVIMGHERVAAVEFDDGTRIDISAVPSTLKAELLRAARRA